MCDPSKSDASVLHLLQGKNVLEEIQKNGHTVTSTPADQRLVSAVYSGQSGHVLIPGPQIQQLDSTKRRDEIYF